MTYGFKMANNVTDLRVTGISAVLLSFIKSTAARILWATEAITLLPACWFRATRIADAIHLSFVLATRYAERCGR